jgi:hypothetical protein
MDILSLLILADHAFPGLQSLCEGAFVIKIIALGDYAKWA